MLNMNGKLKLKKIQLLENKGLNTSLSEDELIELDLLYQDMFGSGLSDNQKKIYM